MTAAASESSGVTEHVHAVPDDARVGLRRIIDAFTTAAVSSRHDAGPSVDRTELLDAAKAYLAAGTWAELRNMPQPMPVWARDQQSYWKWPEELWHPSVDAADNLAVASALIAVAISTLADNPDTGE